MSEPIIRYAYFGGEDEEFDEFIADNCTVHFETMGDSQFWMSIEIPDGRMWHINCGAMNPRAKGYAVCEQITEPRTRDGARDE